MSETDEKQVELGEPEAHGGGAPLVDDSASEVVAHRLAKATLHDAGVVRGGETREGGAFIAAAGEQSASTLVCGHVPWLPLRRPCPGAASRQLPAHALAPRCVGDVIERVAAVGEQAASPGIGGAATPAHPATGAGGREVAACGRARIGRQHAAPAVRAK